MSKFLVSFPRSGQHLTETLLRKICSEHRVPYSYCEYYTCCKQVPCRRKALVQKNHDMDGRLAQVPTARYVVLYRKNIAAALEAYWRCQHPQGKPARGSILSPKFTHTAKTEQACVAFARQQTAYYQRFCQRWVESAPANVLPIEYDELTTAPLETMWRILHHLFPEHTFEKSVVERCIASSNVGKVNVLDAQLQQRLEQALL